VDGLFVRGRGRGRGTPGHVLQFVFTGRREVPNSPFYVIYYIISSGGFSATSSDHHEGTPGKERTVAACKESLPTSRGPHRNRFLEV
jgi:hypothetical protein